MRSVECLDAAPLVVFIRALDFIQVLVPIPTQASPPAAVEYVPAVDLRPVPAFAPTADLHRDPISLPGLWVVSAALGLQTVLLVYVPLA